MRRLVTSPSTGSLLAPRPWIALVALVALLLGLLAATLAPAPASAAGSPNLSLAVDVQDVVLYGKEAPVELKASTPSGAATPHNLSYRAVLPVGVSYVAGSAGAVAGEPKAISGQPSTGQTTLLWVNVADLAGGTSHA
ncbi:MAG: hypothetical protein Q7T55_11880, partial [Solirubrobacteraceae bacterium]|nr:hypothetical protein [Solirubrobacteraceae bacterium]